LFLLLLKESYKEKFELWCNNKISIALLI